MTERMDRRFAALKKDGRAALVTFTMAGDPDEATSLAIIKALPKAGADVIELGMPFTDPMADGPAVQAAGLRALHAGANMKKTLAIVRGFRAGDDATPIVLMGYYNPIYVYGVDKFLADAKAAGVDGLIVVDLPPEEDTELCLPALKAGLNFIRLATPTTDDKRLPTVLTNTSGFVYYVSIARINGSAAPDPPAVSSAIYAHQAAYKTSGLCRLRCAHGGAGPRHRRKGRRRRGRLGADRCGAQEPWTRRQVDGRDGAGGHGPCSGACRRRALQPRLRAGWPAITAGVEFQVPDP